MENSEKSSVFIKSNITLKSRALVKPIDNMPRQFFDVSLDNVLTPTQRLMKTKMLFYANKVLDENGNEVEDYCFKNCKNCGESNNDCQRPQNKNQ
jgi:hypothetical protein